MTPSWKRIKKIKRLGPIAFINMEDIAQKEFIKYVNLMNYTFENGHHHFRNRMLFMTCLVYSSSYLN